MKIYKTFLHIAITMTLIVQSVFALTIEEIEQEMLKDLASYPLTASAVNTLTQASLNGEIDNATAINAMIEFSDYKSPLFSNIVDNHIQYSDIIFLQEQIDAINNSHEIVNYDNFKTLVSIIDGSELANLSPISLATNMYDFTQNFSKAYSADGTFNVRLEGGLAATNNLIATYLTINQITITLRQYTPKGTLTKYLANNTFSKGLTKLSSSTIANSASLRALGWITVGAEIEAAIYMHARDGYLTDIKDNVFSSHRNALELRSLHIKKLIELFLEKEKLKQVITADDIAYIYQMSQNFTPKYSLHPASNLREVFIDKSNNLSYLNTNYQVNLFSELTNEEKIYVAIDALVIMSLREDGEAEAYLDLTIADGQSVADAVFGAIKGSAIYEIYDTESLRSKMFLYYGTSWSALEYYEFIYKIAFNAEVAKFKSEHLAKLGREIERMKRAQRVHDEEVESFSRLLHVDESNSGDEISVSFGKSVEYRDEIIKASTIGKTYKFRYQVDGEAFQVVDATYDTSRASLVFTTPSTQAYNIYQLMIPQAPRWDGDTEERFYTYTLPVGNSGVWAENLNDNSEANNEITDECSNGSTNIACKVGVHLVGQTTKISYGRKVIVVDDLAFITHINGISVMDITHPNNPVLISDMYIEGFNRWFHDMKIVDNYAYIVSDEKLYIIDISNPRELSIINTKYLYRMANVEVLGNYAYLSYDYNKMKIVDISNPLSLEDLATIDYVSGDTVAVGNYLYIADNALKVVDISDLENIATVGTIAAEYAAEVKVVDNYAYLAHREGIKIIDISDPTNPVEYNNIDMPDRYIKNIEIVGNYIYAGSIGSFIIVDISNKNDPTIIEIFGNYSLSSINDIKVIGDYAYIAEGLGEGQGAGFKILDISNPISTTLLGLYKTKYATDLALNGQDTYVVNAGKTASSIIDVSTTSSPSLLGNFYTQSTQSIKIKDNFAYVLDYTEGLKVFNISDTSLPDLNASLEIEGSRGIDLCDNYAYIVASSKLNIVDISNTESLSLQGDINITSAYEVAVSGNYAYVVADNNGLNIVDISNPSSPTLVNTILKDTTLRDISVQGNYAYVAHYTTPGGISVVDISTPGQEVVVGNIAVKPARAVVVKDNYAYTSCHGGGIEIIDVSNPYSPTLVSELNTHTALNIEVLNGKIYVADSTEGLLIFDTQKAIDNYKIIQDFHHSIVKISLTDETPKDYELFTNTFTKSWTFSEDITNFDIEVLSNTYSNNINSSSFTKDQNTISISLTPNTSSATNRLELKLTKDGHPVKIDGSDTFWSLTKTNNAPRFADGQTLQMVGDFSETISLDIFTFDEDGDSVSLSIIDDDGGSVSFDSENQNRLLALFSDDLAIHTIKIRLSDSKEYVEKEILVLRFNSDTISTFYSDVDPNDSTHYFHDIAFATLYSIVAGQRDPDDTTKHIFRPTDDISMAEALAMLIHGAREAGLIELDTKDYYLDTYPSWAMPYYTFAREQGAVDDLGGDLSIIYPSREEVTQMIVKVLDLDEKLSMFPDINTTFNDETDFSNDAMIRYAKVSRVFGLFMTSDSALPQMKVSRADMAKIITKMFMIPHADLIVNPDMIEYGDIISLNLENLQSHTISQSDFSLVDSSSDLSKNFAFKLNLLTDGTYDSSWLKSKESNQAVALLDNNGIRNVITIDLNISFVDIDSDGVQDFLDAFTNDDRYAKDKNENQIPDILDDLYGLSDYNASSTIELHGQSVEISQIIIDGGIFDNDTDGILNSIDEDDDNDGIPDDYEDFYGMDPFDALDASSDSDGDGFSNLEEYKAGTDPTNADEYPNIKFFNPAIINYLLS